MKISRLARSTTSGIVAVTATILAIGAVQAQEFPSKTLEVITHAGAGGGTDVTTRMMMIRSRRELGQDMVVVNKRGGNGAAAMNYFIDQPADAHNVLAFTIGHAITLAKDKTKMKVEDIRPIARGTDDPQIFMVSCKSPIKSGQELVDAMKSTALKFGTTNAGGIDHITAFVFADKGGLTQPAIVPFSGGGEVATQLVAGAVEVGVLNLSEASAQIEAGDICPRIVLGKARMKPIPDAATAQELGIDAVFSTVRGFVTYASTPDDQAAILEEKLLKAMNHAVYQGYLTSVGLDSSSVAGAAEWGEQIKKMIADMTPAIKKMGL